jgi:PiT family inorganic phosphate transporter
VSVSTILLFLALFLSVALVSGNNLAACVGTAVGARIVNQRFAVALGICGFVLGLLTLGHVMIQSARFLLPGDVGANLVSEVLLSTVAVFVLGNVLRVPLSVTSSLTGVLTGVSIAQRLSIDYAFLTYVVAVWVAVPVLSIATAFYLMRAMSKTTPKNIWKRVRTQKCLIVAASFLTAYAAGANSLALIIAISGFDITQISIAVVAIAFGSFFLSSRQIKRVGSEMYSLGYSSAYVTTLTSTVLILFASTNGIPLSSTQTLSAAVFGAGLSHKDRFMAMKPFLMIIAGWIIAPLVSLFIGLLL